MFKILVSFINWLDQLARFSFLMLFIGSIGLGFGMGVIVFSQPDSTWAVSHDFQSVQAPLQIHWLESVYVVQEKSDPIISMSQDPEVYYQPQYGSLKNTDNIVLYSHKLPFFDQVQLGAPIQLTGKNQGLYQFYVTQIKIIQRKELVDTIQSNNNSLIIYQSDDLLSTQLFVIIAQKAN